MLYLQARVGIMVDPRSGVPVFWWTGIMVGGTGIEPVTFAMSTRRSPAELTARHVGNGRTGSMRSMPLQTCTISPPQAFWQDREHDIT